MSKKKYKTKKKKILKRINKIYKKLRSKPSRINPFLNSLDMFVGSQENNLSNTSVVTTYQTNSCLGSINFVSSRAVSVTICITNFSDLSQTIPHTTTAGFYSNGELFDNFSIPNNNVPYPYYVNTDKYITRLETIVNYPQCGGDIYVALGISTNNSNYILVPLNMRLQLTIYYEPFKEPIFKGSIVFNPPIYIPSNSQIAIVTYISYSPVRNSPFQGVISCAAGSISNTITFDQ